MSKLVGYARVSTADQNLALQLDALLAAGAVEIRTDKASGAKADRAGLKEALALLEPGDTLAVWKLDRLGRSLRQLIEVIETVREKGCFFRSLTDAIDTQTASGKLLYSVIGAIAEFERETIRERVKAGIASARRAGKNHGRPAKLTYEATFHARRMLADGNSWNATARAFGVSRMTLSRALRAYPEES